jgi:cell division protein ZipA
MNTMRWVILLIGIVILAGIYVFSTWQSRRRTPHDAHQARGRRDRIPVDVLFDEVPDSAAVDAEPESLGERIAEDAGASENESTSAATAAPAASAPFIQPDKVVTLYVMAPGGVPFPGSFIMDAMSEARLEHGDMQIFHRQEAYNGGKRTLFSVANLVEPGTFDPDAMETFSTPGLVLFLTLPGPFDAVRAFDAMVESARSLAVSLKGTVCDATRSVLTNQTIGHMREDIIDFQLRQRIARTAS